MHSVNTVSANAFHFHNISGEDGGAQCPCDDCVNGRTGQLEGQPLSGNARIALSSTPDVRSPSSCECHFCNASMAAAVSIFGDNGIKAKDWIGSDDVFTDSFQLHLLLLMPFNPTMVS